MTLGPAIDAHHHYIPFEILDNIERYLPDGMTVERNAGAVRVLKNGSPQMRLARDVFGSAEHQLRDMDNAGVQTAVLSAAVFQEYMSLPASRVFNRELAELQQRHGDRFVGLAHVPPFGEDGALEELERAVREYGLKGVCITTSFRGKYPDEPEYEPFYRTCDELGLPIFVHAAGCPVCAPILDRYELDTTMGRPLDHALVTTRVLYGGVLERFRNIRFLMGHLGGAFYAITRRLIPDPASARQLPAVPVRDYADLLRRISYDTAPSFFQSPPLINCAIEVLGLDRILFGSDYPAGTTAEGVMREGLEHIAGLGTTQAAVQKLIIDNAREFFRL